jgi:thimet oligopeptidase
MIKYLPFIVIISIVLLVLLFTLLRSRTLHAKPLYKYAYNVEDIAKLFPKTVVEINRMKEALIDDAQSQLDKLLSIEDNKRTFANTAQALDTLAGLSNFALGSHILYSISMVNVDANMRDAAQAIVVELQKFSEDAFFSNKKVYNAFKAYIDGNAQQEQLSDVQYYFLKETIEGFERAGLHLPQKMLNKVKELKKELVVLSMEFGKNIAQDNSIIEVSKYELNGVSNDFIETLQLTDDGKYILRTDYPTRTQVMENCTVSETRRKWSEAFDRRAYPVNEDILKLIIEKRDELARLLGFESFAALNIVDEMAKTPERAQEFIQDLLQSGKDKLEQELELLLQHLPESVSLQNGKLKPWDLTFIKEQYKRKYLLVDEQKIAEYFPMNHTLDQLFEIYERFMGLRFELVTYKGWWHDDVCVVQVYKKNNPILIGTILLDLYPRDNKYSHACSMGLIPSVVQKDKTVPYVGIVIANFPKPTKKKPSLLTRGDVQTFFHEFGHALHGVLGATELATQTGTHVKTDFVELPSQILEEWIWDKDILRGISKHYQTGEKLSERELKRIVATKQFDRGQFINGQGLYALLSLNCFAPGEDKDPETLWQQLKAQYCSDKVLTIESKFFASFGHLTGYGARYYGYLWSKVFALDIFSQIKKHGLLDPVIGKKYVETILKPGGSQDPNKSLINFLGREPNIDAFIADLGLQKQSKILAGAQLTDQERIVAQEQ